MTLEGLADYAYQVARDFALILRPSHPEPTLPLLQADLRLRLRDTLSRFPSNDAAVGSPRHIRVLDYDLVFADYASLAYLFSEIFVHRTYEFSTRRREPYVVDAGSNIGLAALYFKRRHPGARIVAFEPEPTAFSFLEANVVANVKDGVELVNAALGAEKGHTTLHHDPASLLSSTRSDLGGSSSTAVRMEVLSEYVHRPVDLLKLDVEGAERDVLLELEQAGKLKRIEMMICEYHHLPDGNDQLGEFFEVLDRNGFSYSLRADGSRSFDTTSRQDLLIYARNRVS